MWMPFARFYAYYIDERGDFQYAETSFQINTEMQNEVCVGAINIAHKTLSLKYFHAISLLVFYVSLTVGNYCTR